jgi:hypothetical protein
VNDTTRPIDAEMLDLALDAFRQATARVSAAPAAVARTMYAPLTESAWWAICIDEEFEFAAGYKSARNSDGQGQVVLGLRYARSALGHHRFFAATMAGGLSVPFTVPFKIETFAAWLSVDELPASTKQQTLRPIYRDHVAGRGVLETLADADAWFQRARASFVMD